LTRIQIKIGSLLIVLSCLIALQGCDGIFPSQSKPTVPTNHNNNISGVLHTENPAEVDNCKECHGDNLTGGVVNFNGQNVFTNSCYQCHANVWEGRGGGGGGLKKYK